MFELADRLYKTNNATKSVTINPHRVAQKSVIEASEPRGLLKDRNSVVGQ